MAASDDLLAYWLLEEAAGAARLDSSGNGETLSDSGAANVVQSSTSKFGANAAQFDGGANSCLSRAHASLSASWPTKVDATSSWTIGALFQPTSVAAATNVHSRENHTAIEINGPAGQFRSRMRDSGMALKTIQTDGSGVTTGVWYYVALRYQGDTDNEWSIWLDGAKQAATETVTAWRADTSTEHCVGAVRDSGTGECAGHVDEAWVFGRALTTAEILSIATSGIAAFVTPAATLSTSAGTGAPKLSRRRKSGTSGRAKAQGKPALRGGSKMPRRVGPRARKRRVRM